MHILQEDDTQSVPAAQENAQTESSNQETPAVVQQTDESNQVNTSGVCFQVNVSGVFVM